MYLSETVKKIVVKSLRVNWKTDCGSTRLKDKTVFSKTDLGVTNGTFEKGVILAIKRIN